MRSDDDIRGCRARLRRRCAVRSRHIVRRVTRGIGSCRSMSTQYKPPRLSARPTDLRCESRSAFSTITGNVSDMKIAASKRALRESELFDRPAVEAKIRECARFAAPRRDHRGRAVDSDDLESIARQQTAVRRVAARDIQDAAGRTFAMPLPDLLQKNHFGRNLAGTFQMRAAEDVGILIDARFHRR